MNAEQIKNTEQNDIRTQLETVIEKAKDACERLEERTVAAGKVVNQTVHTHPYQAMGIAFGLGLLTGALSLWKWKNRG